MNQQTFHLERLDDVHGVSGTGRVAEGCVFSDGRAVIHWVVGEYRTTTPHDSIDSVVAIHGHDGRTRIVWHNDAAPWLPDYVPPGPQ